MNPYIIDFGFPEEVLEEFKKIGVDHGGVEIMRYKCFTRCLKVHGLANFSANILKQEMLSLGGDVALSRGTLTGQTKKTDCLILGTDYQISRLVDKLKLQPFGLSELGVKIKAVLNNFQRIRLPLELPSGKMNLGKKTLVMGIINVTPDSFSGDGVLGSSMQAIADKALAMIDSGADIMDIGGESSRPGAAGISLKEELRRVVPLVKLLRKRVRIPLSVDTTKAEVARAVLDSGADIINDISALRFDKKMASVVVRYKAGLVLMHMKGKPKDMQKRPYYDDVTGEIFSFLSDAVKRAQDSGIPEKRLILDPGVGFGKSKEHNFQILSNLRSFKSLGRPLLVGLSRKQFIGSILSAGVGGRAWGTAAAVSIAVSEGADILRVHDVKEMVQVVRICDAVVKRGRTHGR